MAWPRQTKKSSLLSRCLLGAFQHCQVLPIITFNLTGSNFPTVDLSQETTHSSRAVKREHGNTSSHKTFDVSPLPPTRSSLDRKRNRVCLPSPWGRNHQNGEATTSNAIFIARQLRVCISHILAKELGSSKQVRPRTKAKVTAVPAWREPQGGLSPPRVNPTQ